jgi:hypothetical protein
VTREEAIERLEDTFEGWNMWVLHDDSPASKMSEALGMAIVALREQPRWISVEERLPEESGRYLIAVETTGYVGTRYFYEICPGAFTMNQACTHWMPLPEPPTEEEV